MKTAHTENRVNREEREEHEVKQELFLKRFSKFAWLAYFAVKRKLFLLSIPWRAIALATAGVIFIASTPLPAQIQPAWVAHYNNGITNGTHQAVKMALDSAGNIYVIGPSQNANTNLGYITIKYAPNGNQLWASRYDSTNYPSATPSGLVLDNSNSVIVTGSALTVKYDQNGNQLWTAPYAGTALAVDSNANVYVTGYGTQFNTVKLSPTGSNIWQTTYVDVGPTLSQVILVDSNNNVYVSGSDTWHIIASGVGHGPYYELTTIQYNSNGARVWKSSDNTYSAGYAYVPIGVTGIAQDGAGDLYVEVNYAGDYGYFTYKYASNGSLVWTSPNPNGYNVNQATGLALDSGTNVLLTGLVPYAYTGQYSFTYETVKLDTTGSLTWTSTYPQPPVGSSGANAIAVDSSNSVYVTGYSPGANGSNDIVTIKYASNGNQGWLQRYDGPGSGNDVGDAIAVDNAGNVYVTGYDTLPGGGTEIVTIKYPPLAIQRSSNGNILLQAQGSPGENFDVQASADFQTWQDLGQSPADANGLFQYTDTNASNYTTRFYVPIPQ